MPGSYESYCALEDRYWDDLSKWMLNVHDEARDQNADISDHIKAVTGASIRLLGTMISSGSKTMHSDTSETLEVCIDRLTETVAGYSKALDEAYGA